MIVAIGALVIVAVAIWLNVDAQSMSDEKRKELGLGPKGQGRR
jgi:hypothetical protein